MTIAGLSTNISTSGITNDIQIAMLKKNLDTVETAGADIAKMMEASVTPELGQNIKNLIQFSLCMSLEIQSPCTQFSMYMGFIFF